MQPFHVEENVALVPCTQGRYVELPLFFLRPLLKNPVILILGLYA